MKRLLVLLLAAGLTLCGGCAARTDEAVPDLPPTQPVEETPAPEEAPAAEEAPAEEAPAPEEEPQAPAAQGETAPFRLGEEEKELAAGDSLGGWTLESLDIQRQEDGSIKMVTAEFSSEEQLQLEGVLYPSGLLEGDWDFVPTEADAARLPRYAGEDASPSATWAMLTQWDEGVQPPQQQGEQPCRLTVTHYKEVFAYMAAPSSVQVSAVEWR